MPSPTTPGAGPHHNGGGAAANNAYASTAASSSYASAAMVWSEQYLGAPGSAHSYNLASKCRDVIFDGIKQKHERFARAFAGAGVASLVGGSGIMVGGAAHGGSGGGGSVVAAGCSGAESGDRRGLAINVLVMFRDVAGSQPKFHK